MLLRVALLGVWVGALGHCEDLAEKGRGRREASYWEGDKRAPSGFFGVRGKKDSLEPDGPASQLTDKRSPSLLGFQGVRGKKTPSMGFESVDKRAPSGFFGVRGKKGPSSGFFGMRGKKGPSSGFFGMRGKKGPSGFMGVRGKKDSSVEDIDELLQRLRESAAREDGRHERITFFEGLTGAVGYVDSNRIAACYLLNLSK
ncbi:hypothetical protein AAG570_003139 [Ranatra chinensis]|uniref:Uncharacterized protein n=1 Tax=Ranatra chinensis TaxID=642074 RepID=A0ABD0YSM8_9HEMI